MNPVRRKKSKSKSKSRPVSKASVSVSRSRSKSYTRGGGSRIQELGRKSSKLLTKRYDVTQNLTHAPILRKKSITGLSKNKLKSVYGEPITKKTIKSKKSKSKSKTRKSKKSKSKSKSKSRSKQLKKIKNDLN